jgi:hypothetical protein
LNGNYIPKIIFAIRLKQTIIIPRWAKKFPVEAKITPCGTTSW